MSKWLQSGRRRDLCTLLAALGEARGQELKSALESHYDERIEPRAFYGSLSALVDAGFVDKQVDGLHDTYTLTDVGLERVRAYGSWVQACLEEADS